MYYVHLCFFLSPLFVYSFPVISRKNIPLSGLGWVNGWESLRRGKLEHTDLQLVQRPSIYGERVPSISSQIRRLERPLLSQAQTAGLKRFSEINGFVPRSLWKRDAAKGHIKGSLWRWCAARLGSLPAGEGMFSCGFHEANEPVIGWGCYSTIYQMVISELSRPSGCRAAMSRSWHPILFRPTWVSFCLSGLSVVKVSCLAVSLEGWLKSLLER